MKAVDKINEVIAYKQVTANQFAKMIGYNQSNLSKILSGKRNPNNNLYEAIVSSFPEINRSWLCNEDSKEDMLLYVIKDSNKVLSTIYSKVGGLEVIANKMGLQSTTALQEVLDGKRQFENHEIEMLGKAFPEYSREWLCTGEEDAHEQGSIIIHSGKTKFYPNVLATMGDVTFLENPNENYEYISIPNYEACEYAVIAEGNSMIPLFNSGDIVLFNKWNENYIEWGRIYFIVTRGGNRMIKKLYPSSQEGYVVCRSENSTECPDFDIELDGSRIYIVKGAVSVKRL